MADSIAIFYTGDVRGNQEIAKQNHQKLFDRLKNIVPFTIYRFTKDDPERGDCPFEEGIPDTIYRRGAGGAIQVWDFVRGVQRTTEPFVMRLRTDVWFTDSSIDAICNEVVDMLAGRTDIAYFGSDWVNNFAGVINVKLEVTFIDTPGVQDFTIMARRDKLKSFNEVVSMLHELPPKKRRPGNRIFRYIIPYTAGPDTTYTQSAKVFRILCHLWLIRQNYNTMPEDMTVCKDYIQSYILDEKTEKGPKQFIDPHPMQYGVAWWRSQYGWPDKQLNAQEPYAWQLQ